jgi:predicted enzyme related to lactoylglutathione lyase
MAPTSKHGKICYLQIPATDIDTSARFYSEIFGWGLRRHDDGTLAFDDTVGGVSGMWVTTRKPWAGEPGLQVDIMVDNAEQTLAAIVAHGGEIVQPIGWQAPEITAVFRDPAGNLLGIYQEPAQ